MRTEDVHTLILGAGPSGLAAGYTLARAGCRPVIVDRETVPGGLMRSIHHKDFVVDVGRKELYNRLAKVDEFWESLIGADYRPYPHRGGFLYKGLVLEITAGPKGFRRGMSWLLFTRCVLGFMGSRLNVFAPPPQTVEEFFYRTRGRLLTQIASQAFQEKLTGRRWSEMKLPEDVARTDDAGFVATVTAALTRAFARSEVNTFRNLWRHPARGTGQICDALARGITDGGGSFCYGAKLLQVRHENGLLTDVLVEAGGETICFRPQNVIATIPLDVTIKLLDLQVPEAYLRAAGAPTQRKTVVLVYLFFDRAPKFPHAWLQVTDPGSRIGRITNYSGFNSDMVPSGKGCLCCEYYCFGADPLLDVDSKTLASDTLEFCVQSGLVDRGAFVEDLILKLPGADASQNRHNWMTGMRLGLLDAVRPFRNLYCAGRTDLDIATLAGLESAEAILSGDRATFDRHFDPAEIGIRSAGKAFEFRIPDGVDTSPSPAS